jgi:hypothetical protein
MHGDLKSQITHLSVCNMREKILLKFYCEKKLQWSREEHTVYCTRNERSGLAWLKTGIWKLRGMRKVSETGRCPLYSKEEDAVHILPKCSETRKWREQLLSIKLLKFNWEIACKKITNCTNAVELRNIGNYLYKIKCKCENKIRKL